MRPQYVMFLGLVFAAGTIISLTFGGNWMGADELAITNSMTIFKEANILGLWTIMLPNFDFFFTGIKSLMMMDFAFFTGTTEILQWFFFLVICVGAMWGFFTVIISVAQSALIRH